MTKAKNDVIRAVVFKDCDLWVAQCLEHDICAQADDLTEVKNRLDATLDAERDYSVSIGKKPFEGIDPAPKHYSDMWERRTPFISHSLVDSPEKVELALCA